MSSHALGKLETMKEDGRERVLRLLEGGKQGAGERLVPQVQTRKVLSNQT